MIENKGGTNEKFAKKYIKQASLRVVESNLQVFNYLLNKQSDLMFTDEIEAKYQISKHLGLTYLTLPDSISPVFYKAIMLRKPDSLLLKQINTLLLQYKNT